MLSRTHFVISAFFIFLIIPHVYNPIIFSITFLIAGLLPDIDSPFSLMGKNKFVKPIQSFVTHRGVFHSVTLAFVVSLLISLVFPGIALGFFLGYSLHLLSDSFTIEGISPFWPLKNRLSWRLKTGGLVENIIFLFFIIVDVLLTIKYFY